MQIGGGQQREWKLAARVRQHQHGWLLREVPLSGGLHDMDLVEQHRRVPALLKLQFGQGDRMH